MKCNADNEVKNCCCQDSCCASCNYEDCHEGCSLFEQNDDGCNGCEYSKEVVFDEIKKYSLEKLAIYLHSFQCQEYSIEEIKELLNTDLSKYKQCRSS